MPPDMSGGVTGQFFISSQDMLTGTTAYYTSIKVAGTPLGFEVNNAALDLSGGRSDRVVHQPLYDSTGMLRGYVELSDGPAYGQEIVNSVASGWAIASVIAILLAAAAGWLFSRRLSQPIVALTDVTARMAEGDLATRANTNRDDESRDAGPLVQRDGRSSRRHDHDAAPLHRRRRARTEYAADRAAHRTGIG